MQAQSSKFKAYSISDFSDLLILDLDESSQPNTSARYTLAKDLHILYLIASVSPITPWAIHSKDEPSQPNNFGKSIRFNSKFN